jgi:hypothetical protein
MRINAPEPTSQQVSFEILPMVMYTGQACFPPTNVVSRVLLVDMITGTVVDPFGRQSWHEHQQTFRAEAVVRTSTLFHHSPLHILLNTRCVTPCLSFAKTGSDAYLQTFLNAGLLSRYITHSTGFRIHKSTYSGRGAFPSVSILSPPLILIASRVHLGPSGSRSTFSKSWYFEVKDRPAFACICIRCELVFAYSHSREVRTTFRFSSLSSSC